MITQLDNLNREVEGRYATDVELQFLADYVTSFANRLSTYKKIQAAESLIVQQVHVRVRGADPNLMKYNGVDVKSKCERDILFILRYAVISMLLDDTDLMQEKVLIWLQTVLRSFPDVNRRCDLVYKMLQEVVKQHLTPAEANALCPFLELSRRFLAS